MTPRPSADSGSGYPGSHLQGERPVDPENDVGPPRAVAGRDCATGDGRAHDSIRRSRRPQQFSSPLQPDPLSHDTAQPPRADPPHEGVYRKEQELGPHRQYAGWRLVRQIPVWRNDAKRRWPQMCVKAGVPEFPAQVRGVSGTDDEEPVGVVRTPTRITEFRYASVERRRLRTAACALQCLGAQSPGQ